MKIVLYQGKISSSYLPLCADSGVKVGGGGEGGGGQWLSSDGV